MAIFWRIVNNVIRNADIILVVADARMPIESVNTEILRKIEMAGKKYLIVFNKIDLLSEEGKKVLREAEKEYTYTFSISAKEHLKTMMLLRKINEIGHGKEMTVGVVGYPNTGKSSLINAIKGKGAAPVSPTAGFTKALQKIRVTDKVYLLDTPGVLPVENKEDEELQSMISSKNPEKLKDPDYIAMRLILELKGKVEDHYGVTRHDYDSDEGEADLEPILESIAVKMNYMKKKAEPDTKKAAVQILNDWQRGKIIK